MATTTSMNTSESGGWLNYRTIWRWHFYAGLFCIPFVLWLATTGSIYLFRPQIEAWLDKPYENLAITGSRAGGEAQVMTAIAAVPGSNLHYYQLPRTSRSAVQIIVGRKAEEFRVYVNPYNLQVLKVVNEDHRPMTRIFHLHGELLMGDRGSFVVETAASWAVIMILTGLYLWWPRTTKGLGGILFPRLRQGSRIFWRDIHAVTGIWVSCLRFGISAERASMGKELGRLSKGCAQDQRKSDCPPGLDHRPLLGARATYGNEWRRCGSGLRRARLTQDAHGERAACAGRLCCPGQDDRHGGPA